MNWRINTLILFIRALYRCTSSIIYLPHTPSHTTILPPLTLLRYCSTRLAFTRNGILQRLRFRIHNSSALAFSATALLTMVLTHLHNPLAGLTLPGRARKATAGREMGSVKWFSGSKGFGFITRDNGEEINVHFRSLQKGSKRFSPDSTSNTPWSMVTKALKRRT